MKNNQYVFLLELLTTREEGSLISSLITFPNDKEIRDNYANYLLDLKRPKSAELVRKGFTPGGMNDYKPTKTVNSWSCVSSSIVPTEERNNWLNSQSFSGYGLIYSGFIASGQGDHHILRSGLYNSGSINDGCMKSGQLEDYLYQKARQAQINAWISQGLHFASGNIRYPELGNEAWNREYSRMHNLRYGQVS